MNILTLYYICYVILAIYMLDSDQESSYNLSKNLLLLPMILKLIEDMVDDSTPLYILLFSHLSLQGLLLIFVYYNCYCHNLSLNPSLGDNNNMKLIANFCIKWRRKLLNRINIVKIFMLFEQKCWTVRSE